ncbi:ABC transporter ATP-binding protein [Bordetella genomosp. 9]|uniref:ABC transporter ATP-binding protein n=1 Tax=Bordetella genomosp. 9 TaxID=1416803 RepID=UPI001C52FB04|nr:ABC transporter ATP-binding protein [Bordetella genomosp. 9]
MTTNTATTNAAAAPLLRVRGLAGGYTPTDRVVKGVDLDIAPGELVVVVGPNGAGKSTLLKLIAGLHHMAEGSIELEDRPLAVQTPLARARAGIGFVPQENNVFGGLTVRENLEMGAYLHGGGEEARIDAMYQRFPVLRDKRRAAAGTLSGGQRQVVAMAMALMGEPRMLLLDEPSAGLSPAACEVLFDTVRELADGGLTILMIEQNALAALDIADRGIVMVSGAKRADRAARDLAADPETRRMFLGGADQHHPSDR